MKGREKLDADRGRKRLRNISFPMQREVGVEEDPTRGTVGKEGGGVLAESRREAGACPGQRGGGRGHLVGHLPHSLHHHHRRHHTRAHNDPKQKPVFTYTPRSIFPVISAKTTESHRCPSIPHAFPLPLLIPALLRLPFLLFLRSL